MCSARNISNRTTPHCFNDMFKAATLAVNRCVLESVKVMVESGEAPSVALSGGQVQMLDELYSASQILEYLEESESPPAYEIMMHALIVLQASRWPEPMLERLTDDLYDIISTCPKMKFTTDDRIFRIREFLSVVGGAVLDYVSSPAEATPCEMCGRDPCTTPLEEDEPQKSNNVVEVDFSAPTGVLH